MQTQQNQQNHQNRTQNIPNIANQQNRIPNIPNIPNQQTITNYQLANKNESIQPSQTLQSQQNIKQYLKGDDTRLNYDYKNSNLHNTKLQNDINCNNQIKPIVQKQNNKTFQTPELQGSPNKSYGMSQHPNRPNQSNSTNTTINTIVLNKVTDKLYTHFKTKYPTTIDASGFTKTTINTILLHSIKKEPLNDKTINKIIEIIDHKFKMTINSDNRSGTQYNTNSFSMDEETKISVDTYLDNYTNKVTILSDTAIIGEKALEVDLPKKMAPINDTIKIDKIEPFSEDFPIRDREKQTDMLKSETREFSYYVVINSNDRNITQSSKPNEFIIDFAPAPSGETPQTGYIDRSFHNIKSCELLNVAILDTSLEDDSSATTSFPYLLLQFDELQSNYYGTNTNLSKAFAILTDFTKTGNYKYYNLLGDSSDINIYKVYNPRINLTKLTTRLLLPDGTPFNFGDAHNDDTSNSCITFGLRITTIQKTLATSFLNNA